MTKTVILDFQALEDRFLFQKSLIHPIHKYGCQFEIFFTHLN